MEVYQMLSPVLLAALFIPFGQTKINELEPVFTCRPIGIIASPNPKHGTQDCMCIFEENTRIPTCLRETGFFPGKSGPWMRLSVDNKKAFIYGNILISLNNTTPYPQSLLTYRKIKKISDKPGSAQKVCCQPYKCWSSVVNYPVLAFDFDICTSQMEMCDGIGLGYWSDKLIGFAEKTMKNESHGRLFYQTMEVYQMLSPVLLAALFIPFGQTKINELEPVLTCRPIGTIASPNLKHGTQVCMCIFEDNTRIPTCLRETVFFPGKRGPWITLSMDNKKAFIYGDILISLNNTTPYPQSLLTYRKIKKISDKPGSAQKVCCQPYKCWSSVVDYPFIAFDFDICTSQMEMCDGMGLGYWSDKLIGFAEKTMKNESHGRFQSQDGPEGNSEEHPEGSQTVDVDEIYSILIHNTISLYINKVVVKYCKLQDNSAEMYEVIFPILFIHTLLEVVIWLWILCFSFLIIRVFLIIIALFIWWESGRVRTVCCCLCICILLIIINAFNQRLASVSNIYEWLPVFFLFNCFRYFILPTIASHTALFLNSAIPFFSV